MFTGKDFTNSLREPASRPLQSQRSPGAKGEEIRALLALGEVRVQLAEAIPPEAGK